MSLGSHRPPSHLACETCRARKIRCDKGSPCANCKSIGSVCITRPKEEKSPRARVTFTQEYENKIDRIGDRLAIIEGYLQNLSLQTIPTPVNLSKAPAYVLPPSTGSIPTSSTASNASPARIETHDATADTQSAFAGQVIDQAVKQSPIAHRSPALATALFSLKEMLGKANKHQQGLDVTPQPSIMRRVESDNVLPSREEIYDILARAGSSVTLAFCPLSNVESLKEKIDLMLDRPDACETARQVLIFGVLHNLCREYSFNDTDQPSSKRYSDLAALFMARLEAAVAELRIVILPSPEATEALVTAASLMIEQCKPTLALSLTSTAASMAMSLGYHRASTMKLDTVRERNEKILLFWMVYILDTSFAVRLGRAPVIPESDITVPMVTHGGCLASEFVDIFCYWVEINKLQCQTVEQLYSPAALQQSPRERSNRAKQLSDRLEEAWVSRSKSSYYNGRDSSLQDLFDALDSITHHGILALVQHATSTSAIESPALNTARRALGLTVESRKQYKGLLDHLWSGHCHWVLLHAPFTPFTVTFCHIIANPTTSNADLCLLADFVATLQSFSHMSDGIDKLYRLCDIFQRVADLYVKAKVQEVNGTHPQGQWDGSMTPTTAAPTQPSISDMDGHLSAMGFAPPAALDGGGLAGSSTENAEFDANYLQDWFSGNSSLTEFLEYDMT